MRSGEVKAAASLSRKEVIMMIVQSLSWVLGILGVWYLHFH